MAFEEERSQRAPCTFAVALELLEEISKRVQKLAFLHIANMRNSPLPTQGRSFVKGKNSLAVLPCGYFNLIVRDALWKL